MININSRTLNIFIVQGDTGAFTVSVKNIPFKEGDIIRFSVKPDLSPDTPYSIHKEITTFTEDGTAEIIIEPDDTQELEIGKYFYDIEWTQTNGDVNTIIPCGRADFWIGAGVTHE